jgi:hypothetical protein
LDGTKKKYIYNFSMVSFSKGKRKMFFLFSCSVIKKNLKLNFLHKMANKRQQQFSSHSGDGEKGIILDFLACLVYIIERYVI